MKRYTVIAILGLMLLNVNLIASEVAQSEVTESEVAVEPAANVVVFEDPQFEASIAAELGISVGSITTDDMLGLTELRTYGDIQSISGIEYAQNLETFELMYADPSFDDLSPLAGLVNLQKLYIGYAPGLSDISSLSELTNLESLGIYEGNVSDITPLSSLTLLTDLNLAYNQIEDISPLAPLINLQELQLDHNKITDISPLSGHSNLTFLELQQNRIEDISVLAEFSDMITYLDLGSNRITDMSPLRDYSVLTEVYMTNQIVVPKKETTYTGDAISYTLTDIDGTEIVVPLGTPISGINVFENEFRGDATLLGHRYSGNVIQTVLYKQTTLSAADEVVINEGHIYSDEQLIVLFDALNSDGFLVSVDQSLIDYDTPSRYQVIFTDEFGNEKISSLVVNDIFPKLEIDKSEVAIEVGSSLSDITSQIKVDASEIKDRDLNSEITYDDSGINYNAVGTYQLIIRVVDEEGNMVKKSISVVVEDKVEADQGTNGSSNNGSKDVTSNKDGININGTNDINVADEDKQSEQNGNSGNQSNDPKNNQPTDQQSSKNQLTSTGAKAGLLILSAAIVLLILVYIKKSLNNSNK